LGHHHLRQKVSLHPLLLQVPLYWVYWEEFVEGQLLQLVGEKPLPPPRVALVEVVSVRVALVEVVLVRVGLVSEAQMDWV
jgi:hypothetical protein